MTDGISVMETRIPAATATAEPLSFLRGAWTRWKKIARAIGVVQTRIMMVSVYFIFVLPIGVVMRWKGDPLRLKRRSGSNWAPHHDEEPTIDAARRQF